MKIENSRLKQIDLTKKIADKKIYEKRVKGISVEAFATTACAPSRENSNADCNGGMGCSWKRWSH